MNSLQWFSSSKGRNSGTTRFTREKLIRVVADALLLIAALACAILARSFLLYQQALVRDLLPALWETAILLVPIALLIFSFSGFYSSGRSYQSRYKLIIIFQAVSLTYLVFAAVVYLTGYPAVSRSVLPLGWIFTLLFVGGARLWSVVWRWVIRTEGSNSAQRRRPEDIRDLNHILVIGGAGYIGSALVKRLLANGYKVRVLDLLLFGTDPLRDELTDPNLELVQADFRQIDRVVEAMHGIDAVIHLGAIVGDPACALDEDLTKEVNLMATRMIAEVAKGYGVQRFIFASTCSVYGAGDELLDEHSTLNPVSLYAKTKIASENVLRFLEDSSFVPVVLRFGTIYGLSGRTRFDLVVNLLTAKAIMEGGITVFGGDQWRPFVHVDDAARAVLAALEAPLEAVKGEVFNVGSNAQNYTIQQVGERIQELIPGSQLINMGSDTDRRNYRVNFNKIEAVLHFTPEWTLDQGIRQVQEAILTGTVQDYKEAKYSNVRFLTDDQNSKLLKSVSVQQSTRDLLASITQN